MTRLLILITVLCGLAAAQQGKQSPPQLPPPLVPAPATMPLAMPVVSPAQTVAGEQIYAFPLEARDPIRDLQHEYDQIEIENQKMLVKIEQNKAQQSTLIESMKLAAFQFSQAKNINLDMYEFDPAHIRFTKKKAPKP